MSERYKADGNLDLFFVKDTQTGQEMLVSDTAKRLNELERENEELSSRNIEIEVRILNALEANKRFEHHKVREILTGKEQKEK